jgi:glycosyltransferase involved in cell wall biosynthesis
LKQPRVIIVMPAYNASRTVGATCAGIPKGLADAVILVDDASIDDTAAVAEALNLRVIVHPENRGYGGNQKTCYQAALEDGADIVVMLHPDGQYDPAVLPRMIAPVAEGKADLVLGSRMMDPRTALSGGMPRWKWWANRFLTSIENRVLGLRLSEYHTGYRAYSRAFLETIPWERNANGFVFDSQVMVQAAHFGQRIVEVSVPTIYARDSSSIGFKDSVIYGLRTLGALATYVFHRCGLRRSPLFLPPDKSPE